MNQEYVTLSGWLNVYKPAGMLSNKVNVLLKKRLNIGKAGFWGTLDPFAEGVLPVAIGHATKVLSFIEESDKEYIAELVWGEHRDTIDVDGEVVERNIHIPNEKDLRIVLKKFVGDIMQVPPKYSAIKIKGVRACDLMRKGKSLFEIAPRKVIIYSIELLTHDSGKTVIKVKCGKGVYIRSLALDIAQFCGGLCYVNKLCRTRVQNFLCEDAVPFEDALQIKSNMLGSYTRSVDYVLDDIPAITIKEPVGFSNGMFLEVASCDADVVRVYCNGSLLGLGKMSGNELRPLRVFK